MTRDMVIIVMASGYPPCLILGYFFGRLIRATVRIEERMVTDVEAKPDQPTEPSGPRINAMRVLAAIVAVIGVATIALGVMVTVDHSRAEARDDRLTACITGYSNALGDAFQSRQSANSEANEAMDRVMAAFAQAFSDAPTIARDRVLAAIQEYNETRTEAKKTQRENPLPDVPRDACAELMEE